MVAYVDGEWMDSADARISVFDHGLLYGDGVFEGIRFYAHEPFLLDAHIARLEASARAICLDLGASHAAFSELAREAVRRSGMADGYIRLIVTRGPGALGVSPHTCSAPTVILMVAPLALYSADAYANGIVLVTSSLRRSAADALPAQAKTLNYLTSVLASIEARRQGADEAILLNGEGVVAECTADNLFVVTGGRVATPSTSHGALSGITRGLVLGAPARARHSLRRARRHPGGRVDRRRAVPDGDGRRGGRGAHGRRAAAARCAADHRCGRRRLPRVHRCRAGALGERCTRRRAGLKNRFQK